MKHFVIQELQSGIDDAKSNIKWMTEYRNRLLTEKGDPKKLDQVERWLAEQTEKIIQLREALAEAGIETPSWERS